LNIFLRCHPQISVRTPEVLSLSRKKSFAPESVAQFFKSTNPQWTHNIQHNPARLYNGDETGITIVQHKHTKILGLKFKRQISFLKPSERGSLVSVVAFTSPSGHFIPPLLVLRRKNTKQEQMNSTPPVSIHACYSSGWIQGEKFFPVVSSFHQTYKADKTRSSYLSTGGHYSQVRNLKVISLVREDHVDVIVLTATT
jgi:hypothetical protein